MSRFRVKSLSIEFSSCRKLIQSQSLDFTQYCELIQNKFLTETSCSKLSHIDFSLKFTFFTESIQSGLTFSLEFPFCSESIPCWFALSGRVRFLSVSWFKSCIPSRYSSHYILGYYNPHPQTIPESLRCHSLHKDKKCPDWAYGLNSVHRITSAWPE